MAERTGQSIQLRRLELTKIDVFEYENVVELGERMSVAKVFADIQTSDPQLLHLRLVEMHESSRTNVQVVVNKRKVRIETHHLFPATEQTMEGAFDLANTRVNDVFFGLFNDGANAFES